MDEQHKDSDEDLIKGVPEDSEDRRGDQQTQPKAGLDGEKLSETGPFRVLEASRRRSRQSLKVFYLIALCLIVFVLAVVFFGKPHKEPSEVPMVTQPLQQPVVPPVSPSQHEEQKTRVPSEPHHTTAPIETKDAPVVAEAPVQKPDTAVPAAAPPPPRTYTVNVGSFEHRSGAEKFANQLASKGYDAFVQEAFLPQKGTFHRVSVGRFSSRENAEVYAETLREKEKLECFVRKIDEKG